MNTTRTSPQTTSHTDSRFGSFKSLGRGIVASSAVALMGIGTMSAADASAAGVSTGVRHSTTTSSTQHLKPAPTDLTIDSKARYAVRGGKLIRL